MEPFGGGASVLLAMQPHKFEAYNDYNSNLVNMFRCIKDHTLEFLREANLFPLNSRQEFNILRDCVARKEPDFSGIDREVGIASEVFTRLDAQEIIEILTKRADMGDVKRAVDYYKVIRCSYAGSGKSFGGQPVNLPNTLEHIHAVANRLRNVVIDNKDFEDFIILHDKPGTFMYLDPPYYLTEMFYQGFAREDHIRLFNTLTRVKYAKFLLSYNDCEFTRELYDQYTIVPISRLHSMAQRFDAGSQFGELFIANYDINERMKAEPVQLSFIEDDEYYESNYLLDYRNKRPNSHTFYIAQSVLS